MNYSVNNSSIINNSTTKKDDTEVESIDEVGQLLSDIQEEENSILPEINEEPALEISEQKLDASPTQEYDSVLLDQSLEEESTEVTAEQPAVKLPENEKIEVEDLTL